MQAAAIPNILAKLADDPSPPKKLFIASHVYTPEVFHFLHSYYEARGERLKFELTYRQDEWGYLVFGELDGRRLNDAHFKQLLDMQRQYVEAVSGDFGEGTGHQAQPEASNRRSSMDSGRYRPSWISALSDQLRPLSQFSISSDRLKMALNDRILSLIRSSDGSWRQHIHVFRLRSSKTSDEVKFQLPETDGPRLMRASAGSNLTERVQRLGAFEGAGVDRHRSW